MRGKPFFLSSWIAPMPKSKAAKSRTRTTARETPPAPAKPRGTQNPKNLQAILANRAKQPRLGDLRARKQSALELRAKLEERNLGVVAQGSAKHGRITRRALGRAQSHAQRRRRARRRF
jgi:hypothetical protein